MLRRGDLCHIQNSLNTSQGDKGPLHAQYRKNTFFHPKALLRRCLRMSLGSFRLLAQAGAYWITPVTAMPSGAFPVAGDDPTEVRAPAAPMEKIDTLLPVLFVT